METELKLLVDPQDVASFRRNPLLASRATRKPRIERLTTTYFDTPDRLFRQRDAVVRVRRIGRRWIQSLKAGGQAMAGLHSRHEWESALSGPQPDFAALRPLVDDDVGGWDSVLTDVAVLGSLAPIFKTTIRRTVWDLRLESGDEVELALDQGVVESDAIRTTISEIELELKSGSPENLFAFALDLEALTPLRVSNLSKAGRGFALLDPAAPRAVKAAAVVFSPNVTVDEAVHAIMENCMAQIQGNEHGVVHGEDPASVHQMRVGVRRLRAALRIFNRVGPSDSALQAELKWLNAELAQARDWEVLAFTTLSNVGGSHPDAQQMARLRSAAERVAKAKRKLAVAAVQSRRYARLLLAVGLWAQRARLSEARPPQQQVALAAPLRAAASSKLRKLHRNLVSRDHDLEHATAEERHAARKAARRLRYASEFFASLYPAKRFGAFIEALIAVQDELGSMNDAAVAAGLLGQLAETDPDLAAGAAFVNGYLACSADLAAQKIGKRWKSIAASEPPRLH